MLLGLLLIGGFLLRVWNIDYGLPYVWSIDEGTHFTSRAVEMFQQDLDPGYYQNPAAFTYLLYGLLRGLYGPLGFAFDLDFANVTEQFGKDPTEIWVVARALAAVLCMAGVVATWFAARRIWGAREGLVAAAVLCFAFLPVAYSRVAVTDVGALAGVALALYGAVRAHEEGRLRDFAVAGAAAGLATAFKYTAGLALLPVLIAAAAGLRARPPLRTATGLAATAACAALVFLVLNPYLVGSAGDWWTDLRDQAEVAADQSKPGQEDGGLAYYLESLTWGLGWAARARGPRRGRGAAAPRPRARAPARRGPAGPARVPERPGPVLRPLAPARLPGAGHARRRGARADGGRAAGATRAPGACPCCSRSWLAQPLAADIRTARVLGREDTRIQARDWLEARYPPELRVAIEPAVPGRYFRSTPDRHAAAVALPLPRTSRAGPRRGSPTQVQTASGACVRFKPGQFARPDGGVRASAYHLVLGARGHRRLPPLWLLPRDDARHGPPSARSRPASPGARPTTAAWPATRTWCASSAPTTTAPTTVPFNFDLSFNYYPTAYERPGPTVRIYRLRDCRQAHGAPLVRIPKVRELPPFAPVGRRGDRGDVTVSASLPRPVRPTS